MAKLIPNEERILRARALIEKARNITKPSDPGWQDFSYTALVKDTLRQANDLVKFIPMMAAANAEMKQEAKNVIKEITVAEKEILHRSLQ